MRKLFYLFIIGIVLACGLVFSEQSLAKPNNTSGNVIVQTIPGPTVAEKLTTRTKSSWSWYITRGSGMVAGVSLIILILSGIGQVTGYTFKFLEPITAWASHRALGIAFGVSVCLHIFSLLFDHFIKFSFLQLLIPWLSNYKPVSIFGFHLGSLYIALGVLSFYGVIIVVISSLLWIEKKPYIWKLIHLLSYIIMLFVFIHALYLGTDLMSGILRWLWILFGVGVVVAVVHRLWRAKTV